MRRLDDLATGFQTRVRRTMTNRERKPEGSRNMPRAITAPPALIALLIGVASVAFLTFYRANPRSQHRPDVDHLHAAAQFVLHGRDPYPLIGPTDREYRNSWPLYYPMPAVLAVAPLAPLPVDVARGVFVFIVSALFGYAVAVSGGTPWRFAILVSLPFIESVL